MVPRLLRSLALTLIVIVAATVQPAYASAIGPQRPFIPNGKATNLVHSNPTPPPVAPSAAQQQQTLPFINAAPTVTPSIAQRQQLLPLITAALRAVATRVLLHWLPRTIVRSQITRWVRTEGDWCPPRLRPNQFCASRPDAINGVGMVWWYAQAEVLDATGQTLIGVAPGGFTFGLNCHSFDYYGGLWYRTWQYTWVSATPLYTGTSGVLSGVPRC